jgi:lysophospholipase L1-like esterase
MSYQEDFPTDLVRVDGALDLVRTARGLRPRRLPAWTVPQITDPMFDLVVQAASGVRVAVRTQATAVELTLHATRVGLPRVGDLPAVVDLVVDGEFTARAPVTDGDVLRIVSADGQVELVQGGTETIRFDGLPAGAKDVECWLPQSAACDLVSFGADAPFGPPTPASAPKWVHYGSSISHCVEVDGPTGTWPAVAAARAGLHVTNLGFAGNAMLDPFVARTIRDLPADVISLKIGANIVGDATMRRRTFSPAVHGFLDTIRDGHPDTPILVVSPISCAVAEDLPGPTVTDPATGVVRSGGSAEDLRLGALSLDVVRDVLANLVRARASTDPALSYLDGRELLGPDEIGDLHDGLHPNAEAYRRMGARFADLVGPAAGLLPFN